MELIRQFVKTIYGTTTELRFDNDRNIASVVVIFGDEFAEYKGSEIIVKYAKNGITTDLVPFGNAVIEESREVEISLDKPVSASHIYVTVDNCINIEDIRLYEILNDKATNYYPTYFDTVLSENYYLDTVSVFTTPEGYSQYSVYTSLNGRDFELLARKADDNPCDFKTGDIYSAEGREARIIRVYIEYNSESVEALFEKIEFTGEKSGTEIQKRPEINIPEFKDSDYNVEITEEDIYNEVYGIITRRLGSQYIEWFELSLKNNPRKNNYDYFELSESNEKILITGNNGVSLAVGLNHYLKYYCKVNLSQVSDQANMPEKIVHLRKTVFKETKARVRYSYNYCTLSYTMAFWGEEEWQREIDWLALNGVNVVLDATAQEEVWRRFLISIGYTHEEILKFIAGPAYYAWAYMANLSGFGGPVHDSWFYERTVLARKNHLKMRKLGIYPCLQGYSGMVPNDILEHNENADIILQGTWNSFDRPIMLKTTSPIFKEYAHKFYEAQKQVYGSYSIYFATDPFHEGGNVADMKPCEISFEVLSAMLKSNKDAVWIIQSWQSNPTSELLVGLERVPNGKEHALILDLYAEKFPNYKDGRPDNFAHGYSLEFDKTPWVFCMLNNFGGRLGLHGHIDNVINGIPEAYNNCSYIAGIGITPEASFNNPVLYDFIFETVWCDNADEKMEVIDIKNWICQYAERRYGAVSKSAQEAWFIMLDTVYSAVKNNMCQGAPESVVNARPSLQTRSSSTWGNLIICYEAEELKRAVELLIKDYDILSKSEGYRYDLITSLQQILSNTAYEVYRKIVMAFNDKSINLFEKETQRFLEIADLMDNITSCSKHYMLGTWVESAKRLARNTDDFTKMLYELNAKSLITTWGSYNQCETGGLHDYSNRQWSGLIKDFYKPRWERWISARMNELKGMLFEENIEWFPWEWNWVRQRKVYEEAPKELDLKAIAQDVIEDRI